MRVFASAAALAEAAGEELGVSDWHVVTQEEVNAFATATGDHQWIHVDRERAAAGPFGTTIAHGFLTLALIPQLTGALYEVRGVRMTLNYGLNRVRFPAPVPVGSKVRASLRVQTVDEVPGGVQLVGAVRISVHGTDKPCCVAETVTRYLD